jgi:methionyl aminopeptidase
MIRRRRDDVEIKTPAQLESMRRAGLIVAETLTLLADRAEPGVTTLDLDRLAREVLARHGAAPSFLGYHGYPAVICASVNEQVVHGIPSDTPLNEGDILSVDFGAIVEDSRGTGWHGDSAITVIVGDHRDPADEALSTATRSGLWAGLAQAQPGRRLGDIGAAVEQSVRAAGPYGILTDYVGHGIGTSMHMAPDVPNVGPGGRGLEMREGMALAVEPMVTRGSNRTEVLADGWTVVTLDRSRASHWEHTVALTSQGPWVLTAADGGAEALAALGVPSPAASRA